MVEVRSIQPTIGHHPHFEDLTHAAQVRKLQVNVLHRLDKKTLFTQEDIAAVSATERQVLVEAHH